MTRFWWVRHGPTHAVRMIGWTDLPADLSARTTIARLQTALPAHAPVVSSDLLRARQTADAIGGARVRLPDQPAFRECHYGAWENRPFEAIDSPELRAFLDDPGVRKAPGGESWADVAHRVGAAVERLNARYDDVIVVAHMGAILTQWARAAGLSPRQALGQVIAPLSLTRIDAANAHHVAVMVNACL